MSYIIVGLGNPGEEYETSRHNTGRIVLEYVRSAGDFSEWKKDSKTKSLMSKGELGGVKATLIEPETYMNNSGKSLSALNITPKKAEKVVVIYDELDLPIGTYKISFNRGSGGHKGIESIARALKTKAFVRVRVGISPATPSGKIKKPKGEKAVHDFILGSFKAKELEELKKVSKALVPILEVLMTESREKAMSLRN